MVVVDGLMHACARESLSEAKLSYRPSSIDSVFVYCRIPLFVRMFVSLCPSPSTPSVSICLCLSSPYLRHSVRHTRYGTLFSFVHQYIRRPTCGDWSWNHQISEWCIVCRVSTRLVIEWIKAYTMTEQTGLWSSFWATGGMTERVMGGMKGVIIGVTVVG